MAGLRQILAHVNDSPDAETVIALASLLAADQDGVLAAVYAVDPMPIGSLFMPETAAVSTEAMQKDRQARDAKAAALVGRMVPGTLLQVEADEPLPALIRRSHTTDLIVVAQPRAQPPSGHAVSLVEQLVVGAACPLLVAPHGMHERNRTLTSVGRRALIAWSPTRECARAIRDAMPLLQRAQSVELLHLGPSTKLAVAALDAVQAHLTRHGVMSTRTLHAAHAPSATQRLQGEASTDVQLTEALLAHAMEQGVDLIVMGGYSRPRALEWILGGVTRSMLKLASVPVLMAH